MAEEIADRCGQAALTSRLQPRDAGSEAALGVVEPAAEPIGQSQLQLADGVQHVVAVA